MTETPQFLDPAQHQPRTEWIVMERRGPYWGTIGIDAPRESIEAAQTDLDARNARLAADIQDLEARIAEADREEDPNHPAYKAADAAQHYLASLRNTEYAIFERTITPWAPVSRAGDHLNAYTDATDTLPDDVKNLLAKATTRDLTGPPVLSADEWETLGAAVAPLVEGDPGSPLSTTLATLWAQNAPVGSLDRTIEIATTLMPTHTALAQQRVARRHA
jgi:hypothetical protein